MAMQRANDEQIAQFLLGHPAWTLAAGKLHREYRFKDFVQAFGFMAQAALVAERSDHHPEWFNVYSRVVVDLTTHDAQGVSARDFALALTMDAIAASIGAASNP